MKTKITIWIAILLTSAFANAQGWNETEIGLPTPYANSTYYYFGNSVAIDGNYAIVGAPNANNYRGKAYVFERIAGIWQNVAELTASDALNSDYFGSSVSISGDVAVVGCKNDDVGSANTGSVYVFEKPVSGWATMTETAKLSASDAAMDDNLGISVSISGDVIVAGAYYNDDNGSNSGSAYVFVKSGSNWVTTTETAKLLPSDGAALDLFGYSVSVSGNYVVVGAYQDDDNGLNSGSVYLYEKPITGWINTTETAKLTPTDGTASDNFGYSVAISGDVVVVGSYLSDQVYTDHGSAYVFVKPVTGWVSANQTAQLMLSTVSSYQHFGYSVGISGDDIVVGAENYSMQGASFIFTKPVTGWANGTETAKLNASDIKNSDKLGISVAISGDYAISGASWSDSLGISAGSAYIYEKPVSGWVNANETVEIFASTELSNVYDEFGCAVDISGNYAVVGNHQYKGKTGSATIYHFNGLGWDKIALLTASDGVQEDEFGCAVAIDGNTIVIGAKYGDGISNKTGVAYLFEMPVLGWTDMTETARLISSEGNFNDAFGAAVDIDGDIVVVASPQDGESGASSGSVFIFEKPVSGWANMSQTAKLVPNDGAAYDNFGNVVAIKDTILVIGASGDDVTYSNQGSAYIFIEPATGWTNMNQTAKLLASDGALNDNFCTSVAINGDIVAIGSSYSDLPASNCGSIYLYQKPISGWTDITETAKLTASDAASNDNLGASITMSDTTIIAGAKQPNLKGKVYVFNKPGGSWITATQNAIIVASDGANYDGFGNAIAMDFDKAIVGAYQNDDNGINSGSVYFLRNINQAAAITLEPTDNNDVCENSVAVFEISTGNATSGQWQESSDNGVVWTNTTDGLVYNGSQTTSLTVLATTSLNNYQYRCIVSNIMGADTSNAALLTIDAIAPIITSTHPNQTIDAGVNCEAELPDYTTTVVATDNCTASLTIEQNPLAGTTINGSSNTITLTVTDDAGNYNEVTFNVVVADNTNPTISCLSNQTIDLTQGQSTYTVSASEFDPVSVDDNCTIAGVNNNFNSSSSLSGAQLPIGTTTIEWTATDLAGNTATCNFDVTVNAYVGIVETVSQAISILPNPTNGNIVIVCKHMRIEQLNILDITGKSVATYSNVESGQQIDLSNLGNGVYFINILTQSGVETTKIVKE